MSSKHLRYNNFSTKSACLVGFGISLYSFIVELNLESNPKYKPFCDINEHVSCSKAFSSKYGKGFGLSDVFGSSPVFHQPNSLSGMMFYVLYFFINMIDTMQATKVLLFLNVLSNLASFYLASILIFILKDLCILCVSIYFVNAALLFLAIRKRQLLKVGEDRSASTPPPTTSMENTVQPPSVLLQKKES